MTSLLLAIIVSTSIDSTQMQIGEQSQMRVEVQCDHAEELQSVDFSKQLPIGVEAISTSNIDTVVLSDGRTRLTQELVITSFEDTTYSIRPYVVSASNDTIWASLDTLRITIPEKVKEMQDIHDIKDIENVPIWWWDVVKWILLAIGVLLFIGIVVYFVREYNRRKRPQVVVLQKPSVPAEIEALERLYAIKEEKIWQKGKIKQYHSELTDVIRTYIGRRYAIHSTEKTSDETLRSIKPLIDKELHVKLTKMLRLADLVKFAKYEAIASENEQSLDIAYEFVHETTPKEVEPTKEEDKK